MQFTVQNSSPEPAAGASFIRDRPHATQAVVVQSATAAPSPGSSVAAATTAITPAENG